MPPVSIDGFSIREYTAKMRSVDVVKCWPLDESTNVDDLQAKLPPIAVKKFSWWRDVIDSEDTDDDMIVPVRRIGTNGRKISKFVKGKTRVQKKRSIVDIFAVAPQVERIESDNDEADEDDDNPAIAKEGENGVSERNVNAIGNHESKSRNATATKKKEKETIMSKLKKVKKTITKDERFKQKKKEKLKVPNSSSKPSCSQHRKKCEKDMADNSPTYRRKPKRKHQVSEKKAKGITDSKFSPNHQKMVNPVCSNLKKRTKQFPVENSTGVTLCGPNDANFCSNQQGDKHVASDDAAERGDVQSLVEEEGINKHILRTSDTEVTAQPGSPKRLSVVHGSADAPSVLRNSSGTKDNSFESHENQVSEGNDYSKLLSRGYGVASQGALYLCNPGSLHVPQQMNNHQKNDKIVGSLFNPQHSSAYENVNRKPILVPETIMGNCSGHFMQYQPLPQIHHQELMCRICSFPEWKQRESMHGEKGIEKDYVSLPLNSQGELIDLNSNSKGKLTQLPSSRGIAGSSRGLAVNNVSHSNMDNLSDARGWNKRAPSTDQLKGSSADDSMEWSPTFPVPSRLGIYEYDAGRINVELNPLKENEESITPFVLDSSVSNLFSHRSKQNDQAKQLDTSKRKQYVNSDHVSLPVTPSKMRLMGKEFTVDRHVPPDKRIWTDKQIIAENFSAETYNYSSVDTNHDQQNLTVHPVLGTLKGMAACSPSVQFNQAIRKPRVCPPHFSRQIDSVQQNCLGAIKQSPFSLYNQKPNFEETFTGGYKSFTISPFAPVPALMHQYSSQNGGSSSVDLNSSGCAINFPFLRPDSGRNFRPSLSQFSSERPPWFSDAEEKKLLMDFHGFYPTSDRKHHYRSIAGDNRQIDPSVYLASERFCPFTPKFECTLGSGPIKLTAGGKHVLKPCHYNDPKNFRPTYSTIQFNASTAGSTPQETEKSTKIYKF